MLHPALGSSAAARMLPAARSGDVATVAHAYAELPLGDRSLVLQVLAKHVPADAVRRWVQNAPQEALAWAMLGAQTADAAAEARGSDVAERTPVQRMQAFEDLMTEARGHLLRAVGLDDRDPGVWYQVLLTCYALGYATLREDLVELRRRSPFDVEGLRLAVDLLGEKWLGQPGEARALAEEVTAQAPPGSEAHVVMAFVLRDEWSYTAHFEGDEQLARLTLQSPSSLRALGQVVDRSLRSPAHTRTQSTTLVRNHVAHVAWLARDERVLREQMAALGGTVTQWPWALYGDPVAGFRKARRQVS